MLYECLCALQSLPVNWTLNLTAPWKNANRQKEMRERKKIMRDIRIKQNKDWIWVTIVEKRENEYYEEQKEIDR